ncbi:MAG: hypothetical protein AAGD07_04875 [Planctomycetota bacterium]
MKAVIVGGVTLDHHVYEVEPLSLPAKSKRGFHAVRELGGAHLIKCLLERLQDPNATDASTNEEAAPDPQPSDELQIEFGLATPDLLSLPTNHHGLAVFRPYDAVPKERHVKVWRVSKLLGFGGQVPRQVDHGCFGE